MSEILIQSKITTPRLHDKIVHRERLTKLLDENINKNLIIVCAPAGFGKTTLVLDYLFTSNHKHAWFSMPHKGIEDAPTFFEYLISAVKNLNEEFGNNTLVVMKQFTQSPKMSKELVSGCTASLVNEFQKHFKDDIILVIEDLHYIESEKSQKWLVEFFTELLENIPSNLHLILSTRIIPDIYLTQLKARRNILMIDENELTFNEEETTVLLEDIYKYKYDEHDIKLLDENLKGWITGIHLLLQAYGEDFSKVKYSFDISFENIFDFFAQEIFENLSPEQQEFLMVTSLMENFGIEISNAVLGINNSKELTEELIRKNLFIQQVYAVYKDESENSELFSYHALFRNFLNEKLKKSRITQEIKRLMEKIGDIYLSAGDEISAVNYFLEAENFDKAVPLIDKNFDMIYNSGKYDIFWEWLKSLPEGIIIQNANLLYRTGRVFGAINIDYEKCLYYLGKANELYKKNNNEDGIVSSCVDKMGALIQTGKTQESIKEMEMLLSNKLSPKNEFKILRSLSAGYNQLGQYQRAFDLLEKALDICDKYGLNKSDTYYLLGGIYINIGKFDKAIQHYEKALECGDVLYLMAAINCNIAMAYTYLQNFGSSLKYFKAAFKLMENSYSMDLTILVSLHYGLLMHTIGNIEESIKILKNIYPLAEKINSIFYRYYITKYLFYNYYLLDDYDNCVNYLNLNRAYADAIGIEFNKKSFQISEAIFSMKYESNSSDEDKLINAYNYFSSLNNIEYKKHALYYLSEYYLLKNNIELTLTNLTKFLNEFDFESNDLILSRNLIDFALSRPELVQYKNKVHCAFTQFFDRLNIEGTTDEYKRKMRIEIGKLYDVKMSSFGTLQFVMRGKEIPESKWARKKAKSMLAYMMLKPKAKYGKDKLIELFFPDAKAETAEEHFRHAVFSIRSAFKLPYLNILLYEGKMLYLNRDCYFKSDVAEFDENCKIIHSNGLSKEEKIQACKNVINLYKGEFMEGSYEPWCEDLRDEYKNKFISASELLLGLLNEKNENEEIIYYSEILLKHDKLNEKAYLSLVEAYVRTEKKKSARETYSKMLKIYEAELSEKPDSKIIGKIQDLLNI